MKESMHKNGQVFSGGKHGNLQERIRSLGEWFHNFELAGIPTAPNHFLGDYPRCKWSRFAHALPTDLSGLSVLDVGCNAGFHAIEMKRRGAARVVGLEPDERYLAQARLAAEILEVEIDWQPLSVYDVGALKERFDIVLFMGVFYHLRHPLLALDLLYEHVVRDLFVFQSLQRGSAKVAASAEDYTFEENSIFEEPGFPRLHFIEKRFAGDVTNWWIPNQACVEAMLRSAGFTLLAHPEEEVFVCRRARSAWLGLSGPLIGAGPKA